MNKKLIAAAVAASLMSSTALAHTNSIGYVGDGNGGINFWYGSWHDNTQFNEAEIKIIRPDGTTSIDAFNLLSQDSPAGLISGVNFFSSDGTQLIPYDPNAQHPMGMPMESYTWQGLNYANLPTGQYTFVYIPLGDPESNLPGSPTAEWMPMDEVIRSLTITLTQNDINGDANANGILDINEVSVGAAAAAASGPTVVSQGSSQVIGYVAVSGGVIQVVQRTQTDTTWDNMSDGTTANTQVTNTTLTPFEGRIDQIATAQDAIGSSLRNLDFSQVNAITMSNKYDNGMSGTTRGVVAGGITVKDNNIIVGAGVAKLNTDMTGNGDSVSGETTAISGVIGKRTEQGDVTARLTHGMTDYNMSRTIGDFSNAGETSGTDTSIRLQFEGSGKQIKEATVKPIIGITRGKRTVDAYTETGSVQTARNVAESSEMYTYGTVGASVDVGLFNLTALHNTDGVNDVSIGISKETDKVTWNVKAHRTMTDLGDTNSVSLGVSIKF